MIIKRHRRIEESASNQRAFDGLNGLEALETLDDVTLLDISHRKYQFYIPMKSIIKTSAYKEYCEKLKNDNKAIYNVYEKHCKGFKLVTRFTDDICDDVLILPDFDRLIMDGTEVPTNKIEELFSSISFTHNITNNKVFNKQLADALSDWRVICYLHSTDELQLHFPDSFRIVFTSRHKHSYMILDQEDRSKELTDQTQIQNLVTEICSILPTCPAIINDTENFLNVLISKCSDISEKFERIITYIKVSELPKGD